MSYLIFKFFFPFWATGAILNIALVVFYYYKNPSRNQAYWIEVLLTSTLAWPLLIFNSAQKLHEVYKN